MLHCSNPGCQAANPLKNQFCQECSTPLISCYLRAVGESLNNYRVGEAIADRYLLTHPQIVLDTQPSLPPTPTEEIPKFLLPYLRLSPYRLHLPQVYGRAIASEEKGGGEIWLLEYGTFPHRIAQQFSEGKFFPTLSRAWPQVSPLRQLNWLWQMARLWQPLQKEGVASSLLNPSLLKANGPIVLLRELQADESEQISLSALGKLWSSWVTQTSSVLQPFLQQVCQQLVAGQVAQPEQLVAVLDRALQERGRSQARSYQIYTQTDTGPNREHNEDACYPSSGQVVRQDTSPALAIVCDGIGGHEGGEIASHLAIETLQQGVEQLSFRAQPASPAQTLQTLELSACQANDEIANRNDREQRQERQRMGTTLVMALAQAHEMYATHVGDSRIYWVTRSGCHQITLDDDVASREVRMGYALYREALQYPSAGALVQALGMGASARLRPTINRAILDEDCVFLLCSDGLSDRDRVEQYWESEILPILAGKTTVATAGKRLVEIANTRNGHDNVTVALIYCQVKPIAQQQEQAISLPKLEPPTPKPVAPVPARTAQASAEPTQGVAPSQGRSRFSGRFFLALTILLGLGLALGLLSYWLFPEVRSRLGQFQETAEPDSPNENPQSGLPLPPLAVGNIIQVQEPMQLFPKPSTNSDREAIGEEVAANSILKVLKTQSMGEELWLELQVCTPVASDRAQPLPSASLPPPPTSPQTSPVEETSKPPTGLLLGWVRASDLALHSVERLPLSTSGSCRTVPPSPQG